MRIVLMKYFLYYFIFIFTLHDGDQRLYISLVHGYKFVFVWKFFERKFS